MTSIAITLFGDAMTPTKEEPKSKQFLTPITSTFSTMAKQQELTLVMETFPLLTYPSPLQQYLPI